MNSDARRAPIFQNFLGEGPPPPRQGSRLRSSAVAGCAGHNLSPSRKFHSPIKILDLATGPDKYERSRCTVNVQPLTQYATYKQTGASGAH